MSNSNNHLSDNQVSVATFSVVIFYNLYRFTEALKLHTEDQIWNQKPEISTWSQTFLVKSERVSEEISGVSTLICDFSFAKIMESKIRETQLIYPNSQYVDVFEEFSCCWKYFNSWTKWLEYRFLCWKKLKDWVIEIIVPLLVYISMKPN